MKNFLQKELGNLPGTQRAGLAGQPIGHSLPENTLIFTDEQLDRVLCRYGMTIGESLSSLLATDACTQRIADFESAIAKREIFPNPEHIVYPRRSFFQLNKESPLERKKYKILNEGNLKQYLLKTMERWMPDIRHYIQVYGSQIYWIPQEGFSISSGSQVFPLSPDNNLIESCQLLEIYLQQTMSPLEAIEAQKTLFPDLYRETASPDLSTFLEGEV